ncbi:MAG: hypothetical protein WKG32_08425 [Gemmatimonadaceae bacterium]
MSGCEGAGDGGAVGSVTVIADAPLRQSAEALIDVPPAAIAVTSPVADTVAMAELALDQVTVRPVMAFPLASRRVAVSCTVPPTASDAAAGVTATVAVTGAGVGVRRRACGSTPTAWDASLQAERTATTRRGKIGLAGKADLCM